MIKKRKKLKSIKRRKNARPDDIYFVPEFIDLLVANIKKPTLSGISLLKRYKNQNNKCEDCENYYEKCTCEGHTEKPGLPCEDCNENYCVCNVKPTRRYVMDIVFTYLPDRWLYALRKKLIETIERDEKYYAASTILTNTEKGRINRSIYEIDIFFEVKK